MSINSELLERYRAARTMSNTINEQEETIYHKRQRIALENLRTDAYKHTLIQSKRREWSAFRRNTTYRSSVHPVRLSTDIRRSFQVKKQEQSQSSNNICRPIIAITLPPRIYPPIFHLRQVTSKQSMNMSILHETCFLGQFDRKFLISKRLIHSSDISQIQLILFDQHAISERILLEQLQTHFQKENIRTIPFQLPEPAIIARNPRFLYTPEQISLLEQTGFIFSSISIHNLLIRAVPSWLLSLSQRRQPSTSLLDDIISHTIDNILLQTNNSSNNIQMIIYETLKSLACHNAIKFNDILSSTECHHLLNELKSCSMPFICAHGRTSAAILWEYNLPIDNYQVDMIELKQLASIHKWLKES
jgi:DNA mismatch repair ATPase MutL